MMYNEIPNGEQIAEEVDKFADESIREVDIYKDIFGDTRVNFKYNGNSDKCPKCGEGNLVVEMEWDYEFPVEYCECSSCGLTWANYYKVEYGMTTLEYPF